MKESRLTTIARRGLALPAETLEQIRKTGIRCRPQLDVVYQQQAKEWKLRGEESGGAVELLGHYVVSPTLKADRCRGCNGCRTSSRTEFTPWSSATNSFVSRCSVLRTPTIC